MKKITEEEAEKIMTENYLRDEESRVYIGMQMYNLAVSEAEKENRWIQVTEEKPEPNKDIDLLLNIKGKSVLLRACVLDPDGYFYCGSSALAQSKIWAWRYYITPELPSPPKNQ